MANIANTLNTNEVADRLNALAKDRAAWENGTLKQSNEELYTLLDRCFTLLEQMKGKRKLIAELNAMLEKKKIVFNEGTSLATKVARFVFNGNSKRITGYARVLRVAEQEKGQRESFTKFIKRKGGVEEVRKQESTGTLTKSQQAKQHVRFAEAYYAKSAALTTTINCKAAEVQPHAETSHQFSAALLRKNRDGSFSIVFGSNNASLVKQMLAEGGKVASQKIVAEATNKSRTVARKARSAAVKHIAAKRGAKVPALKIAA